jgi:lipoteichoic acid synthase
LLLILLSVGIVVGAVTLTPIARPELHPRAAALWPALLTFWAIVVLVELVALRAAIGLDRGGHGLSLSAGALLALPVLLLPGGRRWAALLVVVLATLLGIANVAFWRRFGSPLPVELVARVADAWEVRAAALEALALGDLWLLAPALAASLGAALGRSQRVVVNRGLPVLCLLGALPIGVHAWRVAKEPPSLAPVPGMALRDGFVAMHLGQAARRAAFRLRAPALDTDARERLERFASSRASTRAPGEGLAAGSNVVLIQVESLNSWVVGLELGGVQVAPALGALARRGLFFPNTLDQTGSGRSSDADHLVLVSQHPLPEAPISVTLTEEEVVALPALLRRSGYRTATIAGEPGGMWAAARRALQYGFEQAYFGENLGPGPRLNGFPVDQILFARAAELAASLERPFLLRIATTSTHAPHEPLPPELDSLDLGELEGTPLGNYLDAVRHFDNALGSFVDRLEPDTLLVVYGDHSESFGFDRQRLHQIVGDRLRTELVPLIIVHPRLEGARRIEHPAGQIDIGPTLLSLLGIARPRSFFGSPLQAGGTALAARWDGAVLGPLSFFDNTCLELRRSNPLPAGRCDPIRAAAREELELSWLVTRRGLGPRLAAGPL